MKNLNIGIVGFGRFGQFISKTLSKHHNILAHSRSDYTNIAIELNTSFYTDLVEFLNNKLDIIIIAVSIESFERTIEKLAKHILKLYGVLIVDVLSVKEYPTNVIYKHIDLESNNIDLLSTHPMFGPDSACDNWKDCPFVYWDTRITDIERFHIFLETIRSEGCNLIRMSPDEHDEYTSKSQFITHLTGRILGELSISSTPINTNGYEKLLEIVDNTCNDSLDLFIGIYKCNKKSKIWLDKFKEAVNKIDLIINEDS